MEGEQVNWQFKMAFDWNDRLVTNKTLQGYRNNDRCDIYDILQIRLQDSVRLHFISNVCGTYSSMALFHMMVYPERVKDSTFTMWMFPRSEPMYSHLLWKGRWQNVILQKRNVERVNLLLFVIHKRTEPLPNSKTLYPERPHISPLKM